MPLVLGGSSAVAEAYSIANSCKFVEADNAKLARTQTAGDRTKWTLSMWVKRCALTLTGQTQVLAFAGDAFDPGFLMASFMFPNKYNCYNYHTSATLGHIQSSKVYRDPAAWYHLVCVWDTGAAAANRMRLYTNGVEETAFAIDANPSLDEVGETNNSGSTLVLGSKGYTTTNNFDGYIAEAILCDGQAYAASDFGEFDSDSPTIWKPKDPSGLTFGTNGFWLDFEDSADLGADVSGEGNDFTVTNLAAADQCVDSPTNALPTLNSLIMPTTSRPVITDGNDVVVTQPGAPATGHYMGGFCAYGMSSGLWYAEVKVQVVGSPLIGVSGTRISQVVYNNRWLGFNAYEWGLAGANGEIYNGASGVSYGDTYTTGDVIGIYLDLDANKLYFAKDGTIMNSGTGISITATTGTAILPNTYFFTASQFGVVSTFNWNFGNGTFASTAVTSAVADANGFGLFEYDPSDGGSASFDGSAKDFLCLCSKNIGSDGG